MSSILCQWSGVWFQSFCIIISRNWAFPLKEVSPHYCCENIYREKLMEPYYLPGNYSIILRNKTTDMECRVRNEVASVWNINILTWTIVVQNFQLSPLHHVLSKYVGLASSLVHKLAVKFHQIKKKWSAIVGCLISL